MTIYGWDCSDYDWTRGPMDLKAAHDDGIRLFTHKATEGTKVRHKRTGEALSRAHAAGVPYLGSYVVPRTPGNGGHGPVAAQVDYFLNYLDDQVPWWHQHPGWFWQVDLEHWSSGGTVYDAVAPAIGDEVVRRLQQQTGRPVLLYAPRWSYGDTIPGTAPLWASAYGKNPAGHYTDLYPGDDSSRWARYSGRTPLVLQYGSRATIGSQPGCDANAIRDVAAWRSLFTAAKPAADVRTPDMPVLYQVKDHPEIYTDEGHHIGPDAFAALTKAGVPVAVFPTAAAMQDAIRQAPAPVDLDALAAKMAPLVVEQLRGTQATAEQIALAIVRQFVPAQQQQPADTGTAQQS